MKLETSERTKIVIILSLLENSEQTGFSLIQMMERKHEFAFSAQDAMIYPVLHKMQEQGLITSYEKQTEVGIRKFYKVRRQGIHFLSCLKKLNKGVLPDTAGGGACAKSKDR